MRRNAISSAVQEEESEINLTPMLDVVFIMLIFFIVTANFIKEPGLEINRPDSERRLKFRKMLQYLLQLVQLAKYIWTEEELMQGKLKQML